MFPRREALGAALGLSALSAHSFAQTPAPGPERVVKNGRLKQSVSRWCYGRIPMPQFCDAVKAMGLTAIDLLEEAEWQVVGRGGRLRSAGGPAGGRGPHARG